MKYGLIGERLSHSYSAEIHSMIADYDYVLKELPASELEGFMLRREFCATNVTIPYKQAVIPYLDEISDKARAIGAVNTVVNKNGRLYGYNTDFAGMTELITRTGLSLKNKKVLILGTGGTCKTAKAVSQSLGSERIITVSRSGRDGAVTYRNAYGNYQDSQIIINTTPCGMYPENDGIPVETELFPKLEGVIDAIYNPLRTNLVSECLQKGIKASGGLYMLVAQAVYASALFLGEEPKRTLTEKVYNKITVDKQNIVLIGMPSSGKTSVGKTLAKLFGKGFADTDNVILDRIRIPIHEFIAEKGEKEFRNIESEAINEISKKSGHVIATGGGAVLCERNINALKRNGILVFLDRCPEKLIPTADRPLSSDREKLALLYSTRYGIYKKAADIIIDGNGTVTETAKLIKEAILCRKY